jgi:hypothetical protein
MATSRYVGLAEYKFSGFLPMAGDGIQSVVFWGLIAQSLPTFSLKGLSCV